MSGFKARPARNDSDFFRFNRKHRMTLLRNGSQYRMEPLKSNLRVPPPFFQRANDPLRFIRNQYCNSSSTSSAVRICLRERKNNEHNHSCSSIFLGSFNRKVADNQPVDGRLSTRLLPQRLHWNTMQIVGKRNHVRTGVQHDTTNSLRPDLFG